ncbi:MAG: hypothetical protein DYG92_13685 [Leptolyngbya sp. PLA1]|nr:hypothetical protein [Leptolyngbya sp. PLA1]
MHKFARATACAASLLVLAGHAAATEPPVPSSPPADPAPAPQKLPAALVALQGEWDGAVMLKHADGASSSIASMSIRSQPDGSILAAFDGFERGEPFEGLIRLRSNPKSGVVEMRSFTTALNAPAESSLESDPASNSLAFGGTLAPAGVKPLPMQHLVRVLDRDHVVIEWALLSPDGSRSVMMTLDLSRLPQGRQASASELMQSPVLLAAVGAPPDITVAVPPTD